MPFLIVVENGFVQDIFSWNILDYIENGKVHLERNDFIASVLSASHPITPNPSFSPKEGLSFVRDSVEKIDNPFCCLFVLFHVHALLV